jgi:hypothetical protein
MVGEGNSGSIGDFAFNDSDPEKMTAYDICMITITVSVQMIPILEEGLIKNVKLIKDPKLYPDEYC